MQDSKDRKGRPEVGDSHFTDTERDALEYARTKHIEHQHRVWLWTLIKGVGKWTAVVAGGLLVSLNVVKSVISAIRDGL